MYYLQLKRGGVYCTTVSYEKQMWMPTSRPCLVVKAEPQDMTEVAEPETSRQE